MTLPTIDFPKNRIKLHKIYENENMIRDIAKNSTKEPTPQKILDVYGPFYLPQGFEDRPYIYSSLVLTLDGKLAFEKDTKSGLVSKGNFLDPQGGLADLWMVNMLRTYCDGVVFGTRTLEVESNITGHIYDQELAEARTKTLGKTMEIPWNIVISRDGKSIPLDHIIFKSKQVPIIILTSPMGLENLSNNIGKDFLTLGPLRQKDEIDYNSIDLEIKKLMNKRVIISTGVGDRVDTDLALKILKNIGINRLLIETPSYMYHLMDKSLLDEKFINYSSLYAGGDMSLGKSHPFTNTTCPGADILSIHIHSSNFLYTRQILRYQK